MSKWKSARDAPSISTPTQFPILMFPPSCSTFGAATTGPIVQKWTARLRWPARIAAEDPSRRLKGCATRIILATGTVPCAMARLLCAWLLVHPWNSDQLHSGVGDYTFTEITE